MVGDSITIVDMYLTVSQVEMLQCLIDPNTKNSINNFNALFKTCIEMTQFKNRIGTVNLKTKSHVKPSFLTGNAKPAEKEIKAK